MYEINIFKSMTKTKKDNNLISSDRDKKALFDFSLLDTNIEDINILEDIRKQCFKNISVANKTLFTNKSADIYTCFDWFKGMIYFKPYKIYSRDGRLQYIIYRVVGCELYIDSRNNIYRDFERVKEIKVKIDNNTMSEDIEVA